MSNRTMNSGLPDSASSKVEAFKRATLEVIALEEQQAALAVARREAQRRRRQQEEQEAATRLEYAETRAGLASRSKVVASQISEARRQRRMLLAEMCLSADEVGRLLNLDLDAVRRAARKGEVMTACSYQQDGGIRPAPFRSGGQYWFWRSDIEAILGTPIPAP